MKNHWQVYKFLSARKILTPEQINWLSLKYHNLMSKVIDNYEADKPSRQHYKIQPKTEEWRSLLQETTGLSNQNTDIVHLRNSFGNYFQDAEGGDVLDMSMNDGFNVLGYNPRTIVTKTKLENFQQYSANNFNQTTSIDYVSDLKFLNKISPEGLDQIQLCEDDSQAVESAVRMAVLSYNMEHDIENNKNFKIITLEGGNYQDENCVQSFFPDIQFPYSEFETQNLKEENKAIENFKNLISSERSKGNHIPAVVIEPIQYNAGVLFASPYFYRKLTKIAQENGCRVVIDETYTCGWVSGRQFCYYNWCSEEIPDIVVFGGRMQLSGFYHGRDLIDMEVLDEKRIEFNFNSKPDLGKLNYLQILHNQVYEKDWLDLHCSDFMSSIKTEINEINKYGHFKINNLRGVGKMFAFDVDSRLVRDEIIILARREGFKISGSGENTIVFTPSLLFTEVHFTYFKSFLLKMRPTTEFMFCRV